jgi:hypothetical protein
MEPIGPTGEDLPLEGLERVAAEVPVVPDTALFSGGRTPARSGRGRGLAGWRCMEGTGLAEWLWAGPNGAIVGSREIEVGASGREEGPRWT